LAKAPETLPGFKDSVTSDAVESAERFGTEVGIYTLLQGTTIAGIAAATAVIGGGFVIDNNNPDDDNLTLEVSDSPPFYCGQSIHFSASKGKEPYKFLANNEVFAENTNEAMFETKTLFNAAGKCPDKVEIRVTDGNGDNASKFVEIQPNVNITLPQ